MNDDQILTIEEAAQFLKMTPRQVYELCRKRSQERMEHPFPAFSIHSKTSVQGRAALLQPPHCEPAVADVAPTNRQRL
jgi:hypothetical protein